MFEDFSYSLSPSLDKIVVSGGRHTQPKYASVPCSSMMPRDV